MGTESQRVRNNMMKFVARPLLATMLATLVGLGPVSPAFAQEPPQSSTQTPANPTLPAPPPPANPGPPSTPIAVSLGVSKYDFTHGPSVFPNFLGIYKPINIPKEDLTNSPTLSQLIHDGKLEISLQEAVELALQNGLDITVQRFIPWYAQNSLLAAKAGSSGGGIGSSAAFYNGASANLPFLNFDPVLTQGVTFDDRTTPINNPFISGTGGTGAQSLIGLTSHSAIYNTSFSQSFQTGTAFTATWDNTRSSSSPTANFFNPSVSSSLSLGFAQQLLSGCCINVNNRNIRIAKNNLKIADLAFENQAITTVTNTITAYWELVYARENVRVQKQAVAVSEKLYNDNKKQLEIGTMAPLDVTRAESELATDRQNLIVAQTVQLQQEQILKNDITKDPLAPNLVNVEIIPTELPARPGDVEGASFEDSIKEAFSKRPDVLEQIYNLKNADIDVKSTANALLPTLTLTGQYSSVGLAGNSTIPGATTVGPNLNAPVLDANGNSVVIAGVGPIYLPTSTTASAGTNHQGFGDAQSQIFHNRFPDYSVGLTLQLPLRNRAAQAQNQRSILQQRQLEAQVQQIKNNALLDVRNTYIALQQDRARVEAAAKARELQQQTFDAEQKKYQLGASTVYLVIQTQRDLVTAQGNELRALADLVEAKANFERAVGRTLEVNKVTIADAKSGIVDRETLIPGTLNGQVVGVDKIFSNTGQR